MSTETKVQKNTKQDLSVINGGKIVAGNDKDDKEIDLLDLGYTMLDKWHYLLLAAMIGAVLLNAFSYFLIKPTYESTSKLYIVSASEDSIVNLSDLNIGSSLTSDYNELMLSYPVLDQIIDKLDLDMSSAALASMIQINNPTQTRVLHITVTTNDPKLSMDIANTLAEVAVDYLPNTMSTNAPNIAQVAREANSKAAPSCIKYTFIGALLGIIVCGAYIVICYMLDDTIHTAEDMEKYFGIVPLTSIPESDQIRHDDHDEENEKRSIKFGKGGKK